MKYIIALFIIFISTVSYAGTWSVRIVKLVGDGAMVEFTRNPTGDVVVVTFSTIIGDGTEQINRKKWNLEAAWSKLNNFDLGDEGGESSEILWTLVTAIRNNPNLTITQAVNWYDTNYPNSLYRGIQLLKKMREWIEDEYGSEPDWDQFKTYVINNTFQQVDSYVP